MAQVELRHRLRTAGFRMRQPPRADADGKPEHDDGDHGVADQPLRGFGVRRLHEGGWCPPLPNFRSDEADRKAETDKQNEEGQGRVKGVEDPELKFGQRLVQASVGGGGVDDIESG